MGFLAHLGAISQVLILTAAASSKHIVKDPYVATQYNACPSVCDSPNPSDWALYHNMRVFKTCDEPMLLNFAVNNPIRDAAGHPVIHACVPSESRSMDGSEFSSSVQPSLPSYSVREAQAEIAWRGDGASQPSNVDNALQQLQVLLQHPSSINTTIVYAYSNGTATGAYMGSMIAHATHDKGIVKSFLDQGRQGSLDTTGALMQVCGKDLPAAYTLGVVSETSSDPEEALVAVQDAVATWNSGQCVDGYDGSKKSQISVAEISAPGNGTININSKSGLFRRFASDLLPRDTCRAIEVHSGNSCSDLARRCGISPYKFTKYNPNPSLCSSLKPGQHVCCSSGKLPDFAPKINPDGTCATHAVHNGDSCSQIAASYSITTHDIDKFNQKTWGWTGCKNLQAGSNICLSKGEPPMPATLQNAVCGPQVAGTKRPDNWSDMGSLNGCPLNACCDIWGQCGTTETFCTNTTSATGAPGTAKKGTNGCISNCGTEIKMNSAQPLPYPVSVGHPETARDRQWRSLLSINMEWEHIHFAFANITENFQVDVSAVKDAFEHFKALTETRAKPRVLSFGGWSFSTSLDSFAIFRNGVTDAERETFATNVVQFAIDNDLDGLDFDWEYPGAPDIPGIPAGSPGDGHRYLEFLKLVRNKLPSSKTLSIAAPASYWYLKGLPIAEISDVVDYIVFMTYDLHGQWDWENNWADAGCPDGGCLRSHVNYTEILNTFSMITKAGVENNKIVAGVASYGRSFGMVDPSCHGPECHFTGPKSGAKPGECTQTPGYLANAEISQWVKHNPDVTTYWDQKSRSTISYSKDGNWVAYNDQKERDHRLFTWWIDYRIAGTALWAIDLTKFVDEWPNGQRMKPLHFPNCNGHYENLAEVAADSNIPTLCMNTYIMQGLSGNLTGSLSKYQELLDNDYDEKFGWYEDAVRKSASASLSSFISDPSKYFDCIVTTDTGDNVYTNHTNLGCWPQYEADVDVYWIAHNRTQFEADLASQAGISPDWLSWDSQEVQEGGGYAGNAYNVVFYGQPHLKKDYTISNPKNVIAKRLPAIKAFRETLQETTVLDGASMYAGQGSDVVESGGMLVFMVSASVNSMAQVAQIGQNYENQEIKNIILWFVTAILFLIPGLEEGAAAMDLANMADMLKMIGTAGDAGMSVYDIVQNPKHPVADIFGLLLGGLSVAKAPGAFEAAAKARRLMSAAHIDALGSEVKAGLGQVDTLVKKCL